MSTMRDDVWRAALREPYRVDDRLRDDRPTGSPGSNLVGIVMIVAGAAAVVAIMAISVATCGASPGGDRLVAASMAVWTVAFAGTCAIA